MKYVGMFTQQRRNNIKTVILLITFPIILLLVTILAALVLSGFDSSSADMVAILLPQVLLVTVVWYFIAYFFHTRIIKRTLKARPVERTDNPRLYNIVENLTIAAGMDMPKICMTDDKSLNACAFGINKKTYTISVTTGLYEALDDEELAGVIGHELTHIKNNDTRLNVVSTIFVNMIGWVATASMAVSGAFFAIAGKSKTILGLGAILLGLMSFGVSAACFVGKFFSKLTQSAISRKREFIADAGGAQMCGNPLAIASALRKIAEMPAYGEGKQSSYAMMYIHYSQRTPLFATHPSVEKRIKILEQF